MSFEGQKDLQVKVENMYKELRKINPILPEWNALIATNWQDGMDKLANLINNIYDNDEAVVYAKELYLEGQNVKDIINNKIMSLGVFNLKEVTPSKDHIDYTNRKLKFFGLSEYYGAVAIRYTNKSYYYPIRIYADGRCVDLTYNTTIYLYSTESNGFVIGTPTPIEKFLI